MPREELDNVVIRNRKASFNQPSESEPATKDEFEGLLRRATRRRDKFQSQLDQVNARITRLNEIINAID